MNGWINKGFRVMILIIIQKISRLGKSNSYLNKLIFQVFFFFLLIFFVFYFFFFR